MLVNNKHPLDYTKSILPKEYKSKDLFILVEADSRDILSTYTNPYNFTRYYWKKHASSNFHQDTYIDPVTYLYYKIRDLGSEISKNQLEATLKETDGKKALNDLSFVWMVENAVLYGGSSFAHIENINQQQIATLLYGCNITNTKDVLENIVTNSNDREVYRQSTWLRK